MKRTIDREVKLHKYLKHKNIIRHYGSRFHDPYNCQFIFMEYAEGGELFDRLCPDVGLPEHVAQNYFKQLISGVVFLHGKVIMIVYECKIYLYLIFKGVSHRDLKPENLLLTSDGKLKIIDFGNATVSINKDGTPKKMVKICGTPPYMAPELFTGSGYFGFQADVWACGCILVAMLAGEVRVPLTFVPIPNLYLSSYHGKRQLVIIETTATGLRESMIDHHGHGLALKAFSSCAGSWRQMLKSELYLIIFHVHIGTIKNLKTMKHIRRMQRSG